MDAFGLYFGMPIWQHTNQALALGVGPIAPATRVVVEGLVLLVAAAGGLGGGFRTFYLLMVASLALWLRWAFPLLFRRGCGEAGPRSFSEDAGCLPPENLPVDRRQIRESARTPAAAGLRSEAARP